MGLNARTILVRMSILGMLCVSFPLTASGQPRERPGNDREGRGGDGEGRGGRGNRGGNDQREQGGDRDGVSGPRNRGGPEGQQPCPQHFVCNDGTRPQCSSRITGNASHPRQSDNATRSEHLDNATQRDREIHGDNATRSRMSSSCNSSELSCRDGSQPTQVTRNCLQQQTSNHRRGHDDHMIGLPGIVAIAAGSLVCALMAFVATCIFCKVHASKLTAQSPSRDVREMVLEEDRMTGPKGGSTKGVLDSNGVAVVIGTPIENPCDKV